MPKSKRDKFRSRWYRRHRPAWRYFHKSKRIAFKRFMAFQAKVAGELDEALAGRVEESERGETCTYCYAEQRHGMIFWWLEESGEYGAKEYSPVCADCGHRHIHRYDHWDACVDCGDQFVNPGVDAGREFRKFIICPTCMSSNLVSDKDACRQETKEMLSVYM